MKQQNATTETQINAAQVSCVRCGAAEDVSADSGLCSVCNDEIAEQASGQPADEIPEAPKPKEDNSYRFMDSSSISMAILPRSVVENIGSRAAFIGKPDMQEVREQQAKEQRIPEIKDAQVATFNLEYLLHFLKVVEKNVSSYITLEVKTGEPIKCVAKGDAGTAVFYLAPYIEE